MLVARCAVACALLTAAAMAPAAAQGLQACRIKGIEREVRCGTLALPENPDAPGGRTIRVRYAVVPAVARHKAPDPVFVFAGGPGQAATRVAGGVMPLFQRLNGTRDIVFIDQRGTGSSNPLECDRLPPKTPVARLFDVRFMQARLAECLRKQDADLAQYATWIAVRDFEAVRAALGAPQINLWGASYGTRAALEYLRQFPQHVRTAVLDGVAPPDMALPASMAVDADAALATLVAQCAADAACRQRHPALADELQSLLTRAAKGELMLDVAHPLSGQREAVTLDSAALGSLLRTPLYAPQLGAVLPYALAAAARGSPDALVGLSTGVTGSLEQNFAEAMHFAVVCADDMPRVDAAALERARATRFGSAFTDLYVALCQPLRLRTPPAAFYEIKPSVAPVLLLSGGTDPATPPRHGDAVAAKLGNAVHMVAPNLGHGVSMQGCAPEQITRFVRRASFDGLERDCLRKLPPPRFFAMPGTTP